MVGHMVQEPHNYTFPGQPDAYHTYLAVHVPLLDEHFAEEMAAGNPRGKDTAVAYEEVFGKGDTVQTARMDDDLAVHVDNKELFVHSDRDKEHLYSFRVCTHSHRDRNWAVIEDIGRNGNRHEYGDVHMNYDRYALKGMMMDSESVTYGYSTSGMLDMPR